VNSWKVILATVVIFAAGVMTGGLLVNSVERTHQRNFHRQPPSISVSTQTNGQGQPHTAETLKLRPPEMWGKEFVGRLNDTLQLAPDQREKIEKIIADGQEQNRAIWTNNTAQMRKVMQDARQQIREQLTPDQRKQFEELMKRPSRRSPGSTNAPVILPPANSAPDAPTNAPGN